MCCLIIIIIIIIITIIIMILLLLLLLLLYLSVFFFVARPQNTTVTYASATTLKLEWEPPQLNLRDGILISYSISCTSSRLSGIDDQRVIHSIARSPYNIASLRPNLEYTCCVQAVTTNGNTPSSCATAPTLEDGMFLIACK